MNYQTISLIPISYKIAILIAFFGVVSLKRNKSEISVGCFANVQNLPSVIRTGPITYLLNRPDPGLFSSPITEADCDGSMPICCFCIEGNENNYKITAVIYGAYD
jgi:hypothetical protein